MNLKNETIEVLKEHNKNIDNIKFISISDGYIPLDDFLILSDINYDDGYGGAEINEWLLIVGDDFYMERREYDGSEWWEYCTMDRFTKPINKSTNPTLKPCW